MSLQGLLEVGVGDRSEVHRWFLSLVADRVDSPVDGYQSLVAGYRDKKSASGNRLCDMGWRPGSWHRSPWNRAVGVSLIIAGIVGSKLAH